jgi:hypothetical protein
VGLEGGVGSLGGNGWEWDAVTMVESYNGTKMTLTTVNHKRLINTGDTGMGIIKRTGIAEAWRGATLPYMFSTHC